MFKTKSIQSRVLLYSGLLIFAVVLVITTLFFVTERERLLEERINVISLEVSKESAYIEREFSKIYENAQLLSFTTKNIIDNPSGEDREFLFSLSERLIDGNPNIIGVNFVFEKNIIGDDADYTDDPRFQNDGQFVSYISKQNDILNIQYIDNYQTYELYYKAVEVKDDFFTEPYYFFIQGEELYVSTVVFPIVEQGEFLGLVGVDFTAEYIFEQMMRLDSEYERRDIIASQTGIILLNTLDQSAFGDHISSIHPNYEIGIAQVDAEGSRTGRMPSGHFEVVQTIELASTGDNWYIFSDVEASVVFGELNQVLYQAIAFGLSVLILGLIALYFINRRLTEPIKELTHLVDDYKITSLKSIDFNVNTRGLIEIELLQDKFRKSIQLIQEQLISNTRRISLQEKQIAIQKSLEAQDNTHTLSQSILDTLIRETKAMIGAIYLYKEGSLFLEATSGMPKSIRPKVELGEGLIGRVAQLKTPQFYHYTEESETWIDFGFDQTKPPYIVLYPLVQDEQLIGVVELVSINSFDELLEDLLKETAFMINASIIKEQNIEKTNELLDKTQKLASELDQKQQDLEVQNEELESQQEELRVTNEELETQQEELRVTNEELQVNMDQIERMNKDLQEARTELEKRTLEAERSNKYKSDFLANMSHELRTPLNSILILSNLIIEQEVSQMKMKEYAETIHSSGSDLLELINGILDLAKVEAGKEEVKIKETNLDVILKELKERFSPLAEKNKLDFVVHNDTKESVLKTDGSKLKMILTNLLSNAIKFTDQGSVSLHIKDEKKDIIFEVTDTGIGIDPDMLESIFEEFHQVQSDSKRSFGGTGLGLSICKEYAKLLHGRITVESTVNEGSTFRLVLPKRQDKDHVKKALKKAEKQAQTRSSEEGVIPDDRHFMQVGEPSILIIDDKEDFLKSMRDYFRAKDINVIVSETGENGLYLADYYIPSIILVDEQLPKMNGQKVVEKLKTNPRLSDVRFYIISGQVEGKEIKGAPFLKKPLSDQVLNELVKELRDFPKRTARILLIEDNKNHQDAVVEYLSNQKTHIKFVIDTVTTKKEAMDMLKKSHYALLVVDLGLSDASEFELVKDIREKHDYNNIPIIVYTGKEFDPDEEKELSSMVQDIIIKGDQSPTRLLHDIELFMSQKDKHSLVTDKTLFQGKKVLVVDDDIRNIFALTGLLEVYDVQVVYNTSGKEAIERLKKEDDVDLVLMDIMMPEMNGYETMEKIRKEENKTNLPIIALTAKSMRGDREKCIKAGANEYLSKPLNKDKLLSVLRVWLP